MCGERARCTRKYLKRSISGHSKRTSKRTYRSTYRNKFAVHKSFTLARAVSAHRGGGETSIVYGGRSGRFGAIKTRAYLYSVNKRRICNSAVGSGACYLLYLTKNVDGRQRDNNDGIYTRVIVKTPKHKSASNTGAYSSCPLYNRTSYADRSGMSGPRS